MVFFKLLGREGRFGVIILTLLDPQEQTPLKRWCFEHQTEIRIGRAPDNDVVLKNDLVSRYHLKLWRQELTLSQSVWQCSNQGKNGTFLNGVLVRQSRLQDGDLLQLSHQGPALKYQFQAAPPAPLPTPIAANPLHANCTHPGNSPHNLFCIHCGYPLQVKGTVRQYQVVKVLGQGGMGTTYLAWNPQVMQALRSGIPATPLLVLKEMNADMVQIAKAQELFEREARILKGLNHPGIPQFLDFFIENDKKYLAMELIHGQDLEHWVAQAGPVAPQEAVTWMIQTCEILEYLHRQSPPIIHRDIKPANLMVRRRDRGITVLDFGAVKEIGTPLGTRIGAEGYSAPEQDRGRPVTQSDLYAIGTTLIFLLTGKGPLQFYQKRGDDHGFCLETVPNLSPPLRQVIERLTTLQVRDRYQTAAQVIQALSGLIKP